MHGGFCCQYAVLREDPAQGAQEGQRCSVHVINHSLRRIRSSCTHGPFLFPYHKHLSEFIWLNV